MGSCPSALRRTQRGLGSRRHIFEGYHLSVPGRGVRLSGGAESRAAFSMLKDNGVGSLKAVPTLRRFPKCLGSARRVPGPGPASQTHQQAGRIPVPG